MTWPTEQRSSSIFQAEARHVSGDRSLPVAVPSILTELQEGVLVSTPTGKRCLPKVRQQVSGRAGFEPSPPAAEPRRVTPLPHCRKQVSWRKRAAGQVLTSDRVRCFSLEVPAEQDRKEPSKGQVGCSWRGKCLEWACAGGREERRGQGNGAEPRGGYMRGGQHWH